MKIKIVFGFLIVMHFTMYSQWVQTNGPNGGNVDEIIKIGTELLMSAGGGGIYKSRDNGNHWTLSISGLPCNESIEVLVEHNGIAYASVTRSGIYFSQDAGTTWFPLNKGIEQLTFYSLYVDGLELYAGNANGGVYYSADGGLSWDAKSNGIETHPFVVYAINAFVNYNSKIYAAGQFLYETSNQGETWNKITIPNLNPNGLRDLIVDQNRLYGSSEGVVFASSGNLASWETHVVNTNNATITNLFAHNGALYAATSQGRYYQSTNQGINWTKFQNTHTENFVQHLYFSSNTIFMSTLEGLYKSTNNGATWKESNGGLSALHIKSLQKNSTYLFAGTDNQGMFRSTDQGANWTTINTGLIGSNAQHIDAIYTLGNTVSIATDNGIYHSVNHGDSWIKTLDPGINKSAFGLDADNGILVTAVAGTGVYLSSDNAQTWHLASTSGLNTQTSYYSIKIKNDVIVASTHNGEVFVSKDLGNTWQISPITSGFLTTYDLEFANNKLYAATHRGVYVSSNLGFHWNLFNSDLKTVTDVLIDGDLIYSATDSGVYVASEKEAQWYSLCDGMGKQYTTKLLIHNDLLFSGTFSSSVWKHYKIEGTLPPIQDIATIGVEKVALCPSSGMVNLYSKIGLPSDSKGIWSPTLTNSNGQFDPLQDSPGIYTFTFDSQRCDCDDYISIEIRLDGQANAGTDTNLKLCKDSNAINLTEHLEGNPDAGGVWSPPLRSGTSIFDPLIDTEGRYTYTLLSTECGTDSATIDVTFVNTPNAGISNEVTICANATPIDLFNQLGGTPDAGGIWSPSLASTTGIFDPNVDASRAYTYTLTNGSCHALSKITITVLDEINAGQDATLNLCISDGSVNLVAYLNGNPTAGGAWSPSLQSGTSMFNPLVDKAGTYTYTTTDACSTDASVLTISISTKTGITDYSIALTEFLNSNSITIEITNPSDFEYSLDGVSYQSQPRFNNLKGGQYTVFGREINGCGFFKDTVYILDYPRFFTPNNDGRNDVWQLSGITTEKYNLYIFDRYGKLLKLFKPNDKRWDGTYNGNAMPASDYWFKLLFEDGLVKTGHFTLKR